MQDIRKLVRPYQTILISVAMILSSLAGLLLGVFPLLQKTLAMEKETRAAVSEVSVLRAKQTLMDSMDGETLRADVLTLTSAVPADKSLSTLFGGVDAAAAVSGVAVTDLTLAKPGSLATESAKKLNAAEKEVGANILPFTLAIAGTHDQIRAFLETISSIRRFFRVRSVEESFEQPDTVEAHVSLDVFYAPMPTTIGSVGAPISALTEKETELIGRVAALQLIAAPQEVAEGVTPTAGGGKIDPFSP